MSVLSSLFANYKYIFNKHFFLIYLSKKRVITSCQDQLIQNFLQEANLLSMHNKSRYEMFLEKKKKIYFFIKKN